MASNFDFSTIQINRIVVHDIPKHRKGDTSTEPNYSERESTISWTLKLFFKDKVTQSLASTNSLKVVYDENNGSPIHYLINNLFASDGDSIVEESKTIARHLFDSQLGNNAAGILMVIFGTIDQLPICILMKLERDKGAQLKLDPETQSFDIEEVQNLMLTQKTKIFKVALFINRDERALDFDGIIADHQIDFKQKKEPVSWFLTKFLGCFAFDAPKITTQKFYNYTRSYIETLPEPLDRAKYIMDLNSYVQKNSQTLNPREFADDYFQSSEHKNNYREYLNTKNFSFQAFPKDNSQIQRKIKKITLLFENDISIVGSSGSFDDRVKLEKLESGQHKAEIVSKIRKIT